jgi:hypothetical protein
MQAGARKMDKNVPSEPRDLAWGGRGAVSGNATYQNLAAWASSPFTGEAVGSKQTPQRRNVNRVIAISLRPCGANQRTASLLPLDGINLRRALIASNKRSAIESNAENCKSLQR